MNVTQLENLVLNSKKLDPKAKGVIIWSILQPERNASITQEDTYTRHTSH